MRIIVEKPELWPFLLASVLLHALLIGIIPFVGSVPSFDEKPVEVFAVTPMPNEKGGNEIADIEKPAVEKRPDAWKFLGMYDSKVPEETVGAGRIGDKPGGRKAGFDRAVKNKTVQQKSEKPKTAGSKKDLFAFNKDIFRERAPDVSGDKGDSFSPGGLDDFYPDFKRGAHTYLNVLRYPDVEYFVRMKRAFKIAFNPEPSLRDYFFRNRVAMGSVDVVLGVSVGRTGDISELFVFRSSGIPEYDEEALRTVRASAPFATPPEKFLADDGHLRMSWTFSVYL